MALNWVIHQNDRTSEIVPKCAHSDDSSVLQIIKLSFNLTFPSLTDFALAELISDVYTLFHCDLKHI